MSATHEEDNVNHDALDTLGRALGVSSDDDAPLPKREAPGILRLLPALIQEAWEKGATFQLDNTTGDILLDGFYKFGPLRLSLTNEGVVAQESPEKKTPILSFNDLVDINYRYWCRLNRPKGVYIHPERPWLDAFRERNMVTRTVIFVPVSDKSE